MAITTSSSRQVLSVLCLCLIGTSHETPNSLEAVVTDWSEMRLVLHARSQHEGLLTTTSYTINHVVLHDMPWQHLSLGSRCATSVAAGRSRNCLADASIISPQLHHCISGGSTHMNTYDSEAGTCSASTSPI